MPRSPQLKRWPSILCLMLGISVFVPVAHATPTTVTLTVDNCSSGCGTGPFGTVTLTQVGTDDVTVKFTLQGSDVFAIGGAADPFGFNVNESFTLSSPPGLTSSSGKAFPLSGSDSFADEGTFSSTITCPKSSCGGGTSGMVGGSITFTLTNPSGLSIADFVPNGDGYLFGADVGVVANNKVTGTGPVGALAPEPASIALFGTGMLAIAFVLRRHGPRL
jgi:hypothetical protein